MVSSDAMDQYGSVSVLPAGVDSDPVAESVAVVDGTGDALPGLVASDIVMKVDGPRLPR